MMKSPRLVIALVILLMMVSVFVSCTAEKRKFVKDQVVANIPTILASIVQAYGAPYSGLIGSFFDIVGGLGGEEEVFEISSEEEVPPEYENSDAQYPQEAVSPTPQELEVELDVIKEVYVNGGYQARSVLDGDTLTQNDNYKVTFRCNEKCYMYIVQLDSTGKMDPIFPSKHSPGGNPVEPQLVYSIPAGNNWFYLDENMGVETIYFIASRSRRSDLEQLFHELEEKNRFLVQRNPVSLGSSVVITRGIGGVRQGRNQVVNFHDGSQGQYASTLFSSIQADFVMTRWFNHR
ncbi:MAG: DUF4384 domain-containing protein [Candidatus Hodarchaeota archaeon]